MPLSHFILSAEVVFKHLLNKIFNLYLCFPQIDKITQFDKCPNVIFACFISVNMTTAVYNLSFQFFKIESDLIFLICVDPVVQLFINHCHCRTPHVWDLTILFFCILISFCFYMRLHLIKIEVPHFFNSLKTTNISFLVMSGLVLHQSVLNAAKAILSLHLLADNLFLIQ